MLRCFKDLLSEYFCCVVSKMCCLSIFTVLFQRCVLGFFEYFCCVVSKMSCPSVFIVLFQSCVVWVFLLCCFKDVLSKYFYCAVSEMCCLSIQWMVGITRRIWTSTNRSSSLMSPIHRGLKSKVGSVHKGTQFQIIIWSVTHSCFSCHSTLLRCSLY